MKHFIEQADLCYQIHKETQTALQVILVTKSFEPGKYTCDDYRKNWHKVI